MTYIDRNWLAFKWHQKDEDLADHWRNKRGSNITVIDESEIVPVIDEPFFIAIDKGDMLNVESQKQAKKKPKVIERPLVQELAFRRKKRRKKIQEENEIIA